MVVLAIVLVIAVVVWLLSVFEPPGGTQRRQPVPPDVPPAAAQAPPPVDVHGAGRTADLLAEWAAPIAEETKIDPQALRAYANAELIAPAKNWPV